MNTKNIVITAEVVADDFERVLFWQNKTKLIALSVFLFLIVLFILIGAISFTLSPDKNVSVISFFPILIPIFLFSFIIYSNINNIKKQAQLMAASAEKSKYVFDKDGMETEAEKSFSKTSWDKFHKVVESEKDFMFFIQKNLLFPIPKRFFNQEQLVDLRILLKEQLNDKAKIFS